MQKRILVIFFICAFFVGGFVLAFNLHAAANVEVLTAEDLSSAAIMPEKASPAVEKTTAAPLTEKTTVAQKTQTPQENPVETSKPEEKTSAVAETTTASPEPVVQTKSLINAEGQTLAERISIPEGFERIECAEGSFGAFMRGYELKEHGTPVYFYDGRQKNSAKHIAVFDMFLGDRDLQQCADSIMRIIAEYYFASQQYEKISFDFVSGFECRYDKWIEGYRVGFEGNDAFWKAGGSKGASKESLESYLNTVFAYASTISLDADAEQTKLEDLQIGDIFIKAGSPGHVVMVADICENENGEKAFLLAQGYMPAQSFHLLKNPASDDDPWYYESEFGYPFQTPEYTFAEGSLKRLPILD